MSKVMSSDDLDLIFRNARTHTAWLDKPVDDALLRQVYDLARMGPTSANMCPMRIVFAKSREAKERLKPALDAGNVGKTMAAPVTAIIGMDIHFFEQLPKLYPFVDAKAWFQNLPENVLEYTALRNASLQGATDVAHRPKAPAPSGAGRTPASAQPTRTERRSTRPSHARRWVLGEGLQGTSRSSWEASKSAGM